MLAKNIYEFLSGENSIAFLQFFFYEKFEINVSVLFDFVNATMAIKYTF